MKQRTFIAQLVLIIMCAMMLTQTDSYYAPYLLAAVFSLFCLGRNRRVSSPLSGRSLYLTMLLSAFCAMMILFANHRIWVHPAMPDERSALFYRAYKLFIILVIFLGSTFSILNILTFIIYTRSEHPLPERVQESSHPFLYFVIPFVSMAAVYGAVYACCYYPAIMSVDAIDQTAQILSGVYSNHHPLCHTLLIKLFFDPVYGLTGDINRAVSSYIIFQILFMSATFAFLIRTMYDLKAPRYCMVTAGIYYAVMPFHIMFSFTIWKDVIFGAFVTLFVIFFVRLLKNIGHKALNITGFTVCSAAFCLFRSNGLFAYVIVAICVFFIFRERRKLIIIMLASIVCAFVVKHTVFPMFSVTSPDTVEMLSIPLQQVTRVFVDNGNVSSEDAALISNIINIDEAVKAYDPGISDPIKNMIRDFGNQQFIGRNNGAFIGMYLRTLIHNPLSYILAWVDQTKGYWNSGYKYMLWYWEVEGNSFGIVRTIGSERINTAMGEYLWLFYNDPCIRIFVSIGFSVWILLLAFFRAAVGKNRDALITTIPTIAIILSLLVSTPAYSEFRYVYSLYCLIPLIAVMTLSKPAEAGTETNAEIAADEIPKEIADGKKEVSNEDQM